jgi:hypothetical protein
MLLEPVDRPHALNHFCNRGFLTKPQLADIRTIISMNMNPMNLYDEQWMV